MSSVLDKIDEKLNEVSIPSFAKGKDIMYLAEYLLKMADYWKRALGKGSMASKTGDYGTVVNAVVQSGLGDLNRIKDQLNHMAKTGKID